MIVNVLSKIVLDVKNAFETRCKNNIVRYKKPAMLKQFEFRKIFESIYFHLFFINNKTFFKKKVLLYEKIVQAFVTIKFR